MHCSKTYCFSKLPIFENLGNEEMATIAKMVRSKNYKKNELIIQVGDEEKKMLVVRKGRVKVSKLLEDGFEQILSIVNEGEIFGDTMLFQEEPVSIYVTAMEPTDICVLEGDQLKKFLFTSPTTLFKITEQITKRMRLLEDRLSAISHKDVDARVANYILEQSTRSNQSFKLTLSKKDLASLLDTSRETISRKFSDFQRQDLIQITEQTVTVLNPIELQKIASK